jgi:hypothetical protein
VPERPLNQVRLVLEPRPARSLVLQVPETGPDPPLVPLRAAHRRVRPVLRDPLAVPDTE